MKTLIQIIATTILLTATQTNAAVFNFTYEFSQTSQFTRTIPMPSGTLSSSGVLPPASIPVLGIGTLDTVSGNITLNPINYEIVIMSNPSVGYVNWAHTL